MMRGVLVCIFYTSKRDQRILYHLDDIFAAGMSVCWEGNFLKQCLSLLSRRLKVFTDTEADFSGMFVLCPVSLQTTAPQIMVVKVTGLKTTRRHSLGEKMSI